ncbi:MAG: thiamine-phosphate kinase [Gammaproteobacteria bacterium]|nr:thiamine-phosphate kinase [Gammaproteobacteria bacterium]MYF38842.1 thiamine-phosphate kinase [Gammaproteobacteria bacterium]
MNEVQLIDLILDRLGSVGRDARLKVGPGDDAAVVAWQSDREMVVSTDVCIDGVHVPNSCRGDLVGYRSVAMCVSDLVAMGALPRYLTIALTVEHADTEWITDFAEGVRDGCEAASTVVIGGNLAKGNKQVTITGIGMVPCAQSIQRNTARPDDDIWITGRLGASVLAVSTIASWVPQPLSELKHLTSTDVFARYLIPPIRTNFVSCLRDCASACTDISDGLAFELEQLVLGSTNSYHVDTREIPLWPEVEIEEVFVRDDSYELLFTASKQHREIVLSHAQDSGTPVSRIGRIQSTSKRVFVPEGVVIGTVSGYSHF